MKRASIVLIILLVLVGGGGAIYYKVSGGAQSATQAVPTAKVERGTLRIAVPSPGKVVSNLDVDLKCKASGTIIELPKDISDAVQKNEPLMRLDPVDEKRNVVRAESNLLASQARLAQAEQNLKIAEQNLITSRQKAEANLLSADARLKESQSKLSRVRELLDRKLASQEEYDTIETITAGAKAEFKTAEAQQADLISQELGLELKRRDIQLSQAQVASDTTARDDAKQRLNETTVYAPTDGVVSSRPVQVGTIISSGTTNVGGGTTIMTISDLSRMFVLASVDESDMGKVALGQEVTITADAFSNQRFRGKVVRIATKGVNVSNVVTFEVKIEVTSPNKTLLKPEMTTNIEIIVAQKADVLLVPSQAVTRKRPAGEFGGEAGAEASAGPRGARPGNPAPATQADPPATGPTTARTPRVHLDLGTGPFPGTVTVVAPDGSTETRDVEVGLTDGGSYEVISGLKEGEAVQLNKVEASSRWRGGASPRGMMGGGRGGR